jgi:hypothetical protein
MPIVSKHAALPVEMVPTKKNAALPVKMMLTKSELAR